MASTPSNAPEKALVTVLDDVDTAKRVVAALQEAGYPLDKIELVTHDVHKEAPEVETPKIHETTANTMANSAAKWGGIGAATGVIASIFAPFPGLGLGMIFMGGLTGAFFGGIAGIQHAIDDDATDLPTLDEYEQLVENGDCLVVVLGTHEEVMRAEDVVKGLLHVRSHIHTVHGHDFHEHPAH